MVVVLSGGRGCGAAGGRGRGAGREPGLHADKDCFRAYREKLDYSVGPLVDEDD
jgi:hypothetical protein